MSHAVSGSTNSCLVGPPNYHTFGLAPANHTSEALSVYIELKAAKGEIEAKDDVVRDVIISKLQFLYQPDTPEEAPGVFGVPLQLQAVSLVSRGNKGKTVTIIQGEVKEDQQEAMESLRKKLRNITMSIADLMDKKEWEAGLTAEVESER
jgi:hypothetical protein